ncbi:MAG: Crp/Fnr family transcriptional regulator [Burkholderiales bacterium]|nr:Crp/Fnr family transcriptional regulator [Burkholderiales bacterium]
MQNAENTKINNNLLHLLLKTGAVAHQDIEVVSLNAGTVLVEPQTRNQHAYFPSNAMVSYFHVLEDGSTVQVAAIGNEGCIGVGTLIGGQSPLLRAVVLGSGEAYRLTLPAVQHAYSSSPVATTIFLKYFQALMMQIGQISVCHRKHTVSEQLCRWLLQWSDRAGNNKITVTQEMTANMLGVRREGITQVIASLRQEGIIDTARGSICIVNRPALIGKSCECYSAIRKEYRRLLTQQDNEPER